MVGNLQDNSLNCFHCGIASPDALLLSFSPPFLSPLSALGWPPLCCRTCLDFWFADFGSIFPNPTFWPFCVLFFCFGFLILFLRFSLIVLLSCWWWWDWIGVSCWFLVFACSVLLVLVGSCWFLLWFVQNRNLKMGSGKISGWCFWGFLWWERKLIEVPPILEVPFRNPLEKSGRGKFGSGLCWVL